MDRCRYGFYSKNEEDVREISLKAVYFLTSVTGLNCSFLSAVNKVNNEIDSDKIYVLFYIMEDIIEKSCNKNEIDVIDIRRRLSNFLGYYRIYFKERMEDKLSFDEFIRYQSYTSSSTNMNQQFALMNKSSDVKDLIKSKCDIRFEKIEFMIEVIEELFKAENYVNLGYDIKKRYSEFTKGMDQSIGITIEDNWKLKIYNNLINVDINADNIEKYKCFVYDLLQCTNKEMLSSASKSFYEECTKKNIPYITPLWKCEMFSNIPVVELNDYAFYEYINYYNYTCDFHSGINRMYALHKKLENMKENYCDKCEYDLEMKARDYQVKLNAKLSANTLLCVSETFMILENLIGKIINYLSFQAMIYDQYCTG